MDPLWSGVLGAVSVGLILAGVGAYRRHCQRQRDLQARRDRAYEDLCTTSLCMREYVLKHGCLDDEAQKYVFQALLALQAWRACLPRSSSSFTSCSRDVLEYIQPANSDRFPL
jgi:hypothetical protein